MKLLEKIMNSRSSDEIVAAWAEYDKNQKRKRIAELAFKIFIAPPDPNCGVIDVKAAFRIAENFYEYEQKYLNGEINNEKD